MYFNKNPKSDINYVKRHSFKSIGLLSKSHLIDIPSFRNVAFDWIGKVKGWCLNPSHNYAVIKLSMSVKSAVRLCQTGQAI